mmetsp:Transcript_9331/g.30357  ORF Transcript_9331/g.30357 Transcript_9331/m.30357 type:complete len:478 (-) Transcript_9331:385-1818(-)
MRHGVDEPAHPRSRHRQELRRSLRRSLLLRDQHPRRLRLRLLVERGRDRRRRRRPPCVLHLRRLPVPLHLERRQLDRRSRWRRRPGVVELLHGDRELLRRKQCNLGRHRLRVRFFVLLRVEFELRVERRPRGGRPYLLDERRDRRSSVVVSSVHEARSPSFCGWDRLLVQVQLYNTTLRDHRGIALWCSGTGTAYAALLDLDLSERLLLDENCVLFLYQSNNNGTKAFRDEVIRNNVVDLASAGVNFLQWSYPCRSGQWSADGIEHGDTDEYHDGNGRTIDQNDPFCDDDPETFGFPDCGASCQTCPGGKYLPFTLNRYLHLGEASCTDCPVGRFLEDDGSTGRWWLHDDDGDCVRVCVSSSKSADGGSQVECPPGKFSWEPGSEYCIDCESGTYSSEAAATFCSCASSLGGLVFRCLRKHAQSSIRASSSPTRPRGRRAAHRAPSPSAAATRARPATSENSSRNPSRLPARHVHRR